MSLPALRKMLRPSFKTYILVLCVFYLLLVFMFHTNLQTGKSPSDTKSVREDNTDGEKYPVPDIIAPKPDETKVLQFLVKDNVNLKKIPRNFKVELPRAQVQPEVPRLFGNADKDPIKVAQEQVESEKKKREYLRQYMGEFKPKIPGALVKAPLGANNRSAPRGGFAGPKPPSVLDMPDSSCVGASSLIRNQFQTIADDIFVFSAFWDGRHNDFDNKENGTYIRLMAIVKQRFTPGLKCYFSRPDGGYVDSTISYYEMCENHGQRYGGYILSCRMPKEVVAAGPVCAVEISNAIPSAGNKNLIKVKVTNIQAHKPQFKFALCAPPLFGEPNLKKLVEWIELSLILGAEHITFYDYSISESVRKALAVYSAKGLVTVIPWQIPARVGTSLWYNGQSVAIQDCLWRHMGVSEHLALNDIDEFMVPHVHNSWGDLVNFMRQDDHCAYQFNSAFFDPAKQQPWTGNASYGDLYHVTNNRRTSVISTIRTKCMMQPLRIFEAGIHHISKPILAHLKTVRPEVKVALLHHYRSCMQNFGMSCAAYEKDDSVHKFADKLHQAMHKALLELQHNNVDI